MITFTFAVITIYMIRKKQPYGMALLPGMFYMLSIPYFMERNRCPKNKK